MVVREIELFYRKTIAHRLFVGRENFEFVELKQLEFVLFDVSNCQLNYRCSVFKVTFLTVAKCIRMPHVLSRHNPARYYPKDGELTIQFRFFAVIRPEVRYVQCTAGSQLRHGVFWLGANF